MKRKVVNPDPIKKKMGQAREKVREQDLKKELNEEITSKKSRKK